MALNLGGIFDPQRGFDMVAAFAGAVIAIVTKPARSRREAVGMLIVALLAAFVGTAYLSGWLPPGDGVRGVAGCLIGFLSFPISKRALEWATRGKLPFIGREGRDG